MSYPTIVPNFQVMYNKGAFFPVLVFIDEEPGCPGLARHLVLCHLDDVKIERAARDIIDVQNSLCYKITKWFRALRNEYIWRTHWWRNQ